MRLFVSYARVDKPYCIQIVDTLEVHEVWYDQRLYAGQNWWKEILRRLDWSEGFVYLLSPDSVASEYCNKEYELARNLGRHIIPVVIRENTDVPKFLLDLQYVNLSKGITMDGVKSLLNSIYLAEHDQHVTVPVSSISPEEIKQPAVPPPTVIRLAATAMENGQFDQAVFLLRQAKANGYTSRFINLDAILKEAEVALERQTYLLEAEREYKQIAELLGHKPTSRIGWEAFQAFQKAFPDYDPDNLVHLYKPDLYPSTPVIDPRLVATPPSLPELTLPLLEWCSIPAGQIQVPEVTSQGQRLKKQIDVGAFQISKYPVTNAQYQLFIEDPDGYSNKAWWQFSPQAQQWRAKNEEAKAPKFKGDERPREMTNWYDAMAFCRWLSSCLGVAVTLPSMPQWQRAFQGNDTRSFPWGSTFEKDRCNTAESQLKMTTPVNRYPNGISPYGVYDMVGNVWEWCLDVRVDATSGKAKSVVRGGSYISPYQRSHIAFQYELDLEAYHASIGFRIARNA